MTVIVSTSRKPGFNLAAEEYLFSQSQEDIVFLYINNPCVVIGSNQAIHEEVNLNYCKSNKIEVMRRLSGGGAVYHDNGNLNFCFIRNRVKSKFPLGTDFLKPIVKLLNEMGLPVVTGKRKDLWLNGLKISGTASHIGNKRAMHHGTLLYDSNLQHLKESLAAESQDIPSENSHISSHFSESENVESKKKIRAISSVPSPVLNIRDYLISSGKDAPSSIEYFRIIISNFLTSLGLTESQKFKPEEIAQITEIQKNVYQKVHWIYKK